MASKAYLPWIVFKLPLLHFFSPGQSLPHVDHLLLSVDVEGSATISQE